MFSEKTTIALFLFIALLIENDHYITHAVNVAFFSLIIALAMKYTPVRLKEVGLGALLINAGMLKLPAYILQKKGRSYRV